jgi:DsbC/DsbD-like thiol-disulfide interchange protein
MSSLPVVVLAALCATVAASVPCHGQLRRPKVIDVAAAPVELIPGRAASAAVTVTVTKGYKVQANPPSEGLVPTTLTMEPAEGFFFETPKYPKNKVFALEGVGDLLVYDGTVTIVLPLSVARSAAPGPRTLKGTLRYQACDDTTCLLPANVPVTIDVNVVALNRTRQPS